MKTETFTRETLLDAAVSDSFAWHARPGAIERLSPPWAPLTVLSRTGGILPGAEVVLKMKAGPWPYRWHARHTRYEENRLFEDEQVSGPFAEWVHTHAFEPVGAGRSRLIDSVRYRLPLHGLTRPVVGPVIQRQLNRIFAFRHRQTATDLALHSKFQGRPRQTILISGAAGLIGSRLVPFLKTGGHRVLTLVRRSPKADHEIFWDLAAGRIDQARMEDASIDAVIHLAGENVTDGRWTPARKKRIADSRERGTALIAAALSRMKHPPETFLCASAIGFYGHRGDEWLPESAAPGQGFLSRVCRQWESAAGPAVKAGIRTVFMRIGVVLTPEGGALKQLLPLFRIGLGGRIGSGRQYWSWISMDDTIGAVYYLLLRPDVAGPVNIVSPRPVTSAGFTRVLARVLSRPAFLHVPGPVIQTVFGEMGKEAVLAGARVQPQKLVEMDYPFLYPELQSCFKHLLGIR